MANIKNFATALVQTAPSPATSGTSLVVESGKGTRFPTAPFYCTVHPANAFPTLDNAEVVYVTAVSTDTFTITRAQKGTTAQTIVGGGATWRISNAIYTEDLANSSTIIGETPTGAVDGSNTAYTIASSGKVTGSLKVFKNGVRMKGGGADYTETSNGFTMVTAPPTGTVLIVDYVVGASADFSVGTNSFITEETPSGTLNGSNTSFSTARAYIAGSLELYLNGLKLAKTADYTETTPTTGAFTLTTAPLSTDTLRANYQYNLNPSSNSDTVDGIHANSTATANQLYPLNANAKYPATILDGTTGGWTSFVPTWTGITIGNATVSAYYFQMGKTVMGHIRVIMGTTSSITGNPAFSAPVTAAARYGTVEANIIGVGYAADFGSAAFNSAVGFDSSTTAMKIYTMLTNGTYGNWIPIGATAPVTWGSTDIIVSSNFMYEAA